MSVLHADPWLGEHLGTSAFRADPAAPLAELERALAETQPGFAYVKVPADQVARVGAFARLGFGVVDVNVTFEQPARVLPEVSCASEITLAPPSDPAGLLDVAGQSFRYSRYHLDPRVPDATADAMRRSWVQSYLNGARGDALFVAERAGKAEGFLAALVSGEAAVIDLIAVSPTSQRAGIGRALIQRFSAHYAERVSSFRVGTQIANTPSLGFYEALGFRIAAAAYVLHRHAESPS